MLSQRAVDLARARCRPGRIVLELQPQAVEHVLRLLPGRCARLPPLSPERDALARCLLHLCLDVCHLLPGLLPFFSQLLQPFLRFLLALLVGPLSRLLGPFGLELLHSGAFRELLSPLLILPEPPLRG